MHPNYEAVALIEGSSSKSTATYCTPMTYSRWTEGKRPEMFIV